MLFLFIVSIDSPTTYSARERCQVEESTEFEASQYGVRSPISEKGASDKSEEPANRDQETPAHSRGI